MEYDVTNEAQGIQRDSGCDVSNIKGHSRMVERDVTKCGGVEWSVLKALGVALGQMRDRSKQRTAATRI